MTEGPLNELKAYAMSQGTLGNTFNATDSEVNADIKQTFKRYEKARISFDAPIVANLCLVDNKARSDYNEQH